MKLDLKYLIPYLPYRVRLNTLENEMYLIDIKSKKIESTFRGHLINIYEWDEVKPILKPMSDLNVNHPCMVEINKLMSCEYNGTNTFIELNSCNNDPYNVMYLPYNCFEKLLSHHFDVFGLIEKGLAIDINTLES